MACVECERRRVIMLCMMEATKEWAKNPTGPSVPELTRQKLDEAKARGEWPNDVERGSTT